LPDEYYPFAFFPLGNYLVAMTSRH